jgi:phenylpropionate dioxygenase-like ring-hydroxylating dioxygenase large terminal subunit
LITSDRLPGPRSFAAVEVDGVAILLVRARGGEVRAFRNTCAHRGTTPLVTGCGRARSFTCPKHGWTFGQDGALRTPGTGPAPDRGTSPRLAPLRVVEQGGTIWLWPPGSGAQATEHVSSQDLR